VSANRLAILKPLPHCFRSSGRGRPCGPAQLAIECIPPGAATTPNINDYSRCQRIGSRRPLFERELAGQDALGFGCSRPPTSTPSYAADQLDDPGSALRGQHLPPATPGNPVCPRLALGIADLRRCQCAGDAGI